MAATTAGSQPSLVPWLLYFWVLSAPFALGTSAKPPDDLEIDTTEVKLWALRFGKDIAEGSAEASFTRNIKENYAKGGTSVKWVQATDMVNEMRVDVQNMMAWKAKAVQRLYEAAETAALAHKFDKTLEYDNYYNGRAVYDPRNYETDRDAKRPDAKPLEMAPMKNFDGTPVNTNESIIHVPTNVYEKAPAVVNGIKWSEQLNHRFKNNMAVDSSLSYQFFGSSDGFLRLFPAKKWKVAEEPDMYDSRLRRWYIQAAASPKDLVILLDGSGSMTGLRKEIARYVVVNILDTLTDNDYFTVLRFSEVVEPVDKCFENGMALANEPNIRSVKEKLKDLETKNMANFSRALIQAFELLQLYNRTGRGSQCNQAIMLITDGAPSSFDEIFRRFNWPNNPVRVFTYLIGREVTDIKEVNDMACSNRGYYTHVTTLAEVREQVLKYIPVMSRPLVLYNAHEFFWTPVYADVTGEKLTDWIWEERERLKIRKLIMRSREIRRSVAGMMEQGELTAQPNLTASYEPFTDGPRKPMPQMMTTVASPVFYHRGNNSAHLARLLGVVGTDLPIREIIKLTPAYKLGVGGYSFIINNNGYILYHPDHRPFFQDLIKPGYNSVDLTEVEQEDLDLPPRTWGPTMSLLRNNMIERKVGWNYMKVKIQMDGMRRILTRNNSYYYGGLEGTPFTLGVALPKLYGHYSVEGQVEVKGREENWTRYFEGDNWRVHPDWVYCAIPPKMEHMFNTSEDIIKHFLKEVEGEQNFKWRTRSTNPTIFEKPNCEKELIQKLVFDAKVTNVYSKHSEKMAPLDMTTKYEEKMVKLYGIVVTYVATRSGLLRYDDLRSEEEKTRAFERPFYEQHPRSIDELFYRRAVDFHFHNDSAWVFSVPFDAGARMDDPLVTGSHAIFLGGGTKKAPAAVVGVQFKYSAFSQRFFNITSMCMQNCHYKCSNDELDCYLLDNNGFVVVSEKRENVGKFFGEIDSTVFMSMNEHGIYRKVTYYDYQAICQDVEVHSGPASMLLTPFHHLKNVFLWVWGKAIWFFVQSNMMTTYDWAVGHSPEYDYEDEQGRDFPNKTRVRPCDKQIDLYEMKALDSEDPIPGRLSSCHSSGCDKQFIVQPIPFTNLMMVALYNTCQCEASSVPLVAEEIPQPMGENETCRLLTTTLPRKRPESCYFYHSDEAEIKQCGRGPTLASSSIFVLLPAVLLLLSRQTL